MVFSSDGVARRSPFSCPWQLSLVLALLPRHIPDICLFKIYEKRAVYLFTKYFEYLVLRIHSPIIIYLADLTFLSRAQLSRRIAELVPVPSAIVIPPLGSPSF
jgi:hypothetical protein